MPQSRLFEVIAERSKDLTEGQQRIGEYVLRHPSHVAFRNARELAEALGVSESSVVRFAYSAGFEGYRDLQTAARQVVNGQLSLQQRYLERTRLDGDLVQVAVGSDVRNLEALLASLPSGEIERAALRLAEARRVFVAGYRASAGLAAIAASAIGQLCHNCTQLWFDEGQTVDQLVGAGREDVLLAFSFRRYARRTLRVARVAHERDVFVVAVTDSVFSPLRDYADVALVAEVESPNFTYSLVAPLAIVNCLVFALTRHLGDHAAALIRDWEETYRQFDLLEGLTTNGGGQ